MLNQRKQNETFHRSFYLSHPLSKYRQSLQTYRAGAAWVEGCVYVSVCVGGWRDGGRHSAGSVFNLHRQVRLLDEMFDFQMNTALPLHCADTAHHVGPIWNYEWWVKLLTDRTGRTCLYAVYTTAAHVCSDFVFSLCGIQNTQTRRSTLWICLYSSSPFFFFFLFYPMANSLTPQREIKSVPTVLQFFTNVYASFDLQEQTFRNYSFQVFVPITKSRKKRLDKDMWHFVPL